MIWLAIGMALLLVVSVGLLVWAVNETAEPTPLGVLMTVVIVAALIFLGKGIDTVAKEPEIRIVPVLVPTLVESK